MKIRKDYVQMFKKPTMKKNHIGMLIKKMMKESHYRLGGGKKR